MKFHRQNINEKIEPRRTEDRDAFASLKGEPRRDGSAFSYVKSDLDRAENPVFSGIKRGRKSRSI